MEKQKKEQIDYEKRKYISPEIEVLFLKMEQGIAANSAVVTPGTTNGNTDPVNTEWEGSDDTSVDAPFFD
ncbi:TPA: hypothetical protein ACGZ99_003680 [Elizabethkingia anophelis]